MSTEEQDSSFTALEPLSEVELDFVIGGQRAESGYVCTASSSASGEDCWKE